MACYTQRCVQGRQPCPTPYACSGLKTTCGGESVDTDGTLDEPIRRSNVLAVGFAVLCFALMGAAAYYF